MTAYYSLLVIGLCILIGYAGQISLGHAVFFSIGGYMSAFLTTHNFSAMKGKPLVVFLSKLGFLGVKQDLYGAELLAFNPWPACILSVCTVLIIAYVIGGPVLKLKGHYLAMATLGFGIIIYRIVLGTSGLGAADGISGVPGFTILPGVMIGGSGSGKILNLRGMGNCQCWNDIAAESDWFASGTGSFCDTWRRRCGRGHGHTHCQLQVESLCPQCRIRCDCGRTSHTLQRKYRTF
jgi:hypothetical protein